ncbi:hypothetical protein BsWGS_26437 [Bradybaena similaris]
MVAAGRLKTSLVQVFVVLLLWRGGQVRGQAGNDTGQGRGECQHQLMSEVYTCVAGHGLDFNVFLDLVSGGRVVQNATTAAALSPAAAAAAAAAATAAAATSQPAASTTSQPAAAVATTSEPAVTTTSQPATAAATSLPPTSAPSSPPTTAATRTSVTSVSKEKICGPRQEIMGCIVKSAKSILQGSTCGGVREDAPVNDQRFLLKEQLEAIIGEYDVFCAHPCRISLLDDMRVCYSKNQLDPQLFMSSDASGPVIGATTSEVEAFCENSPAVFTCLRQSRDDCQESQVVLSSIGLDLERMDQGVQVLCANREAYMQSLGCFDSHTKEVEYCQSIKYRTILAMAVKARTNGWTEQQYYQEVCGIILRHIQCDLDAWKAKADEDCTENTLVLKRKLHCTLIPEQCQTSHNETVAEVCTLQRKSMAVKVTQHWSIVILISLFLVRCVDT